MNSTATYIEPVNRIKQRILFDDNLDNVSCLCTNWEEFVIEISEWGIYKLGGVDFDTLTLLILRDSISSCYHRMVTLKSNH